MLLGLDIALAHLLARKRQTLVSTAGVAIGVAFSIAMAALMQGSQEEFVAKIVDYMPHVAMKDEFRAPPRQPAEIRYQGGAVALRGLKPRDELRGIREAGDRIKQLSATAGVHVAPTLIGQAFLRYGGKDVSVRVMGIEPERERRVSRIERDMIADGFDVLHGTANGLIIGTGLAARLGVGRGGSVTVTSAAGVTLSAKVVGLFRTGIVALDEGEAYMLLRKAQILLDRPNVVNEIRMRLDDSRRADDLARGIEARFGYKTESWQEANEGLLGVFMIRNMIMYATVGAILAVACFGIYNVVSTTVFEKVRDIAILKSLGFHEDDIRRIFLVQGLLVGILGALMGWGLGYLMIRGLAMVRFDFKMDIEMQGFFLAYSFLHYLIAGGFAVLSAAGAAYFPARKAAALRPVDIIRGAA